MVGNLMADDEDPLDDVIGVPSTLTTTEPTGALAGMQTFPERHISTVNRQRIKGLRQASQKSTPQAPTWDSMMASNAPFELGTVAAREDICTASALPRRTDDLRLGASQSWRSQHQLERTRRNHADEANPHATPNTPLLPKEWS